MSIRALLLIFFLTINSLFAQRTLVYPIILVHGWTGNASSWDTFTGQLESNLGLTIERSYLSYHLNFDNNLATSNLANDVADFTSTIGNKDVYVINFDVGAYSSKSNQSAAVKQGYALKFAINRVLRATGADKVVLLGHSMGGLAIREYLQNVSNWQPDFRHHVAKIATIGTPHGGSNFTTWGLGIFGGYDENSEAVRDLRTSYEFARCTQNGKNVPCSGVYLTGGQETRVWLQTNLLGGSFHNVDVNCNGVIGETIIGLNIKPINTDLDFACVIGGPNNTDGVVLVFNQDLNNFKPQTYAELFYYDCNGDAICHTNEPKNAFLQMLQALDEPKKYLSNIQFGFLNKGIFTKQANGNLIDTDEYIISVPQRGIVTLNTTNSPGANGVVSFKNQSGIYLNQAIGTGITATIPINVAGDYIVSFSGNATGTATTYSYSLGFCPLPPTPTITASGATSFCDNQFLNLTATAGYEEYKWFKDGVQIAGSSNQIAVNQTGTFTFQGLKCGTFYSSTNNITTSVKPTPAKPTIGKDDQPTQFVLTSSSAENNQWFINGNQINGASSQTYIPQDLGGYTVKVSKDGCSNSSDIAVVKMDKPIITLVGSNPICEGDSLKLVAAVGFGNYIFSEGTKQILTVKNEIVVKKSGSYSLITQRGKFLSVQSDPVVVTANSKPSKPTITLEGGALKSSSAKNNQWYVNKTILKDSTGQFLRNVGAGSYTVQVILNGCFSESEALLITAIEPTKGGFLVKLYPNPNQGTFTVELPSNLKSWHIDIYDEQGKQIFTKTHSDNFTNKEDIKIDKVSGTYILRITSGTITQSTKFVIN